MRTYYTRDYQKFSGWVSPADLTECVSAKDNAVILGGNQSVRGFSIWAAEPIEVFDLSIGQEGVFEALHRVLSKYALVVGEDEMDWPVGLFGGGWIGFFSYDLARHIEKIPRDTVNDPVMPLVHLAFYDKVIVLDHSTGQYGCVALERQGETGQAVSKIAELTNWFQQAQHTKVDEPPAGNINTVDTDGLRTNISKSDYLNALSKTHRYICSGDVYQINFSQRFKVPFSARPVDLFHWQNRYNPSPYAAFIQTNDWAVVSASPEMFLTVRGQTIFTRPIKGTRRRYCVGDDAHALNETEFHDLVESPKDQAELAMIIDLERNDLARICIPGTRYVSQPRMIETFPTVYHAAATVEGQLDGVKGPQRLCDILRAMFPGGSITGAPKIRAMDIIEELEPTARGVYTGAIGWIGLDYDLVLNIAIRTMVIKDGQAYAQTGGGIVADSDPEAEWEETITKARAMIAGITVVNQSNKQS